MFLHLRLTLKMRTLHIKEEHLFQTRQKNAHKMSSVHGSSVLTVTFRMPQHTSSEVTVGCGCIKPNSIIFRNTHRINSFFPYNARTSLTAFSSQRSCTRLAVGTVMTFT